MHHLWRFTMEDPFFKATKLLIFSEVSMQLDEFLLVMLFVLHFLVLVVSHCRFCGKNMSRTLQRR